MVMGESEKGPSGSYPYSNVNVPYFLLVSLEMLSIFILSRKSYNRQVALWHVCLVSKISHTDKCPRGGVCGGTRSSKPLTST